MAFLEPVNQVLIQMMGPLGPLMAVGTLGVLLILIVLLALPKGRADPLDKLKREAAGRTVGAPETGRKLRQRDGGSPKLDRFANFLEPKDEKELSSARLKMLQAGYPSKSAVRTFHAVQFGLAMSMLVVGVLSALVNSVDGEIPPHILVLYMVGPAFVGYYLPKYWIERRRTARQQVITEGFPDALDMMLVCVEAGQSLDQSILRVAREMRTGYPALSEEFEMVSHEVKAGKERVAVLKDMSERCGVQDVQSFVTVLVQSATFGTSIADALRVYAAEMRDKRVMRAEEKANVLPTKLTLGTMMLTVPPLMIILVGPSVYGIFSSLGGGALSP